MDSLNFTLKFTWPPSFSPLNFDYFCQKYFFIKIFPNNFVENFFLTSSYICGSPISSPVQLKGAVLCRYLGQSQKYYIFKYITSLKRQTKNKSSHCTSMKKVALMLTYFCPPFQHLLSERLTSLGIMGAPEAPHYESKRSKSGQNYFSPELLGIFKICFFHVQEHEKAHQDH